MKKQKENPLTNKNIKRFLFALLLCISFQAAYNISNAASLTDTKRESGYISLSMTKEKDVAPNHASITFSVENTAGSAQKASAENNEISNKVIQALKLIISPDTASITTTGFSIRPVYSKNSSGKRVINDYTAVNSVTVETKDIEKISELIGAAVANGANRTKNLSYSFENYTSVCNELYPELLKELKHQASSIAQASGTSLDGVKYISTSCNKNLAISGRRVLSQAMANDTEGISEENTAALEPGKIKIKAAVNADFYVK